MNLKNFADMDTALLMSIVNTKLRDEFDSLSALANFYEIAEKDLIEKLASQDYVYQKEINQFR